MRAHIQALEERLEARADHEESLRRELDELRARVDALEAQAAAAPRERRVAPPAGSDDGPRRVRRVAGALAAVVFLLAMVPVFLEGAEPDAPEPGDPPAPSEARPELPPAAPEPAAPEPAPRGEVEAASWKARVERVSGLEGVATGSSCRIRAAANDLRYLLPPQWLEVWCGETSVYRREGDRGTARGLERWDCDVHGQDEEDSGLYVLRCADRGPDLGRPELVLDTAAGSARLWAEDLELALAIERPTARIATGRRRPENSSLPLGEGRRMTGRVTDPAGPLRAGAMCRLSLVPRALTHMHDRASCRVTASCGGRVLYRDARGRCRVDPDLHLVSFLVPQQGGAPGLESDLSHATVASIDEERTWRARIEWDSP